MNEMPLTVWVLVCDAARAMFFQIRDGEPAWHLVDVVSHPESRSDSPYLDRDVEKEQFAHSLVQGLDRAMRASRFRRWVLVAPPDFIGFIKSGLTFELEKHLIATVDKDMAHMPLHTLPDKLRDAVCVPAEPRDELRQ